MDLSGAALRAQVRALNVVRSRDLAAGEGVEPSSSSSKPEVLPFTPSRKTGYAGLQPASSSKSIEQAGSLRTQALVAVEGIEPTSLDYQSSALAVELHRDLVLSFTFQVSS